MFKDFKTLDHKPFKDAHHETLISFLETQIYFPHFLSF
jgi:hypothetical protein